MIRPVVEAFWPRTLAPGNMGDVLTPRLITWFYGLPPKWVAGGTPGSHLVVGSVIKYAGPEVNVWGTGAMRATDRPSPGAIYHAVRGPLTREIILGRGGECPEVYGDPALLLPHFHADPVEGHIPLGIVPHYVDYAAALRAWGRLPGVRIVNILRTDPLEVVDEIRECRAIVSSSLHGLIVAQAYGIPAALIGTLWGRLSGDGTKFKDYFLSTGQEPYDPIAVTESMPTVELQGLCRPARLEIDLEKLMAACPFRAEESDGAGPAPVVISFYTPDYAAHAENLRADCRRLGVECRIEPREAIDSWIDNTRLKGPFVLEKLRELGRPVLWIDADGSLLRRPVHLNGAGFDFAAWRKEAGHPRPWSVGTLYFAPTEGGILLAERWAQHCQHLQNGNSDEAALALAWAEVGERVIAQCLPESYFKLSGGRGVIHHRLSGNASRHKGAPC